MTLYRVEHPDAKPAVLSAASLVVHDGFLHAMRYGGQYVPGTETVASWAPGRWLDFRAAERCPKCGQTVREWD